MFAGVFDRSSNKVNFKVTAWWKLPRSATKLLVSLLSHRPPPLAVMADLPGAEDLPRVHGPSGPFDVGHYPKAMLAALKPVATGRFDLNVVHPWSQPPQLRAPGDLIVRFLSDLQLGLAFAVPVYPQPNPPFLNSLPLGNRVRPHIEVQDLDAMTAVASDALRAEKFGVHCQPRHCAGQADQHKLSQGFHGNFPPVLFVLHHYP
jgi:hypothetical protein